MDAKPLIGISLMPESQFKTLKPSRSYLALEQFEERRVLLGAAVIPTALALAKMYAAVMACRLISELVLFGGFIRSVLTTLLLQFVCALAASFTIALAIACAFTLTLFFERSTRGLLNELNFLSMFGSLTGFLSTIVWFHFLPNFFIQPSTNYLLAAIIIFTATAVGRWVSMKQSSITFCSDHVSQPLLLRHLFALTAWAAIICVVAEFLEPLLPMGTFFAMCLAYVVLQVAFFQAEHRQLRSMNK